MPTKEPVPPPPSSNIFAVLAAKAQRSYITPEDVDDLLKIYPQSKVQSELLAVIGAREHIGIEDYTLCASVASKPPTSPPPPLSRK